MSNLILGSSHILQLGEAIGRFDADWQTASQDLIPIASPRGADNYLLFSTNRPNFLELKEAPDGAVRGAFGPLMEKVRAFNRSGSKVVLGMGGNEHNIRFLLAHPRPFDFLHPAAPGVEPGRQVVPCREVAALMLSLQQRTFVVTRLLAAELPEAELYFLPPPPPIPSEAHIRQNREVFDFEKRGVEAASVRLKLYALYLENLRAFCAKTGIRLLDPPPEHQDETGFLLEAYWAGCTHAKAAYYDGIVSELGL